MSDSISFTGDSITIGGSDGGGTAGNLALDGGPVAALANTQVLETIYSGIPIHDPTASYTLTLTSAEKAAFPGGIAPVGENLTQLEYDLQYLRAQGFSPPPLTWAVPSAPLPAAQTTVGGVSNVSGINAAGGVSGGNRGAGGGAINVSGAGSGNQIGTAQSSAAPTSYSQSSGAISSTGITAAQQSAIDALKNSTATPSAPGSIPAWVAGVGSFLWDITKKGLTALATAILAALGRKIGNAISPNQGPSVAFLALVAIVAYLAVTT